MRKLFLALLFVLATTPLINAQGNNASRQPAAAPAVKPAAAPAAKPTGAPTADEAVRQASKSYVDALNAGNFPAAAAFWTADGEFVAANGRAVKARKLVTEDLAKRFAEGKRPQLLLKVGSVRLATPETAIEEGSVDVKTLKGETVPRANYTAVWVKQQNKWLLHSLREIAPAPSHRSQLSELSWLLGDWTGQNEEHQVRIHAEWAPGKAFLLRHIRIEQQGELKHEITQRIGLDPMSPRIKSWSFDSDGGIAEAFWDKAGSDWHVFSRGATSTGQMTSAKNVYSDIGPNGFSLESFEAHVGSEAQPKWSIQFKRDPGGDSASSTNAAADEPAADEPPPNAPSFSKTDEAARQKILNSPEWRDNQRQFHEWLSVQKIYTPAEVKQMRAALQARIDKMSPRQLQDYMDDAHQKLALLMGKEAEQVRSWLAQRMAVEVNLTPAQIKKMRPDVANMTAAQVEQWLAQWQQQRDQTKATQQAFNEGRAQQVKNIQQAEREAEREREAALNRAYESSAYGYYYGGGGAINNPGRGGSYGWGYRY